MKHYGLNQYISLKLTNMSLVHAFNTCSPLLATYTYLTSFYKKKRLSSTITSNTFVVFTI